MSGPVVIGCSPSSGSTLLRTVLGRLPGVVAGGELGVLDRPHFFDVDERTLHDQIERWARVTAPRSFVTGINLVFPRAGEWGLTLDEVVAAGRESAGWHELLRTFFARSLERSGGRRWLEKTPGNVYAFERTLEAFPDARFVHVLRDGRDVATSLLRRGASPFLAVSRWFCAVHAGRGLLGRENVLELRYEELVRDPPGELARVCGFLGEEFDEALLSGEAEAAPAIGTWTVSQQAPITADAVGAHLKSGDYDVVLAHLAATHLVAGDERSALDLLRDVGYACDDEPRALTREEIAAAEAEVEAYVAKQRQRHKSLTYPVPTCLR